MLKDISGVFCYLDDILISGATEAEDNGQLRKVLAMLQSAGLRDKHRKMFYWCSTCIIFRLSNR